MVNARRGNRRESSRQREKGARHFLNPASNEGAIGQAAKEHHTAFDELVQTALRDQWYIDAGTGAKAEIGNRGALRI
jgi:hypothetical protein